MSGLSRLGRLSGLGRLARLSWLGRLGRFGVCQSGAARQRQRHAAGRG
ncbi:hypothetical protein [Mycolicibacter minnesotensis]